jgi:tyrosinase
MTYIRKNVWQLGGDWPEPILWYARAVAEMKNSRNLSEPTSWKFYAAIHGFNAGLWQQFGYLRQPDTMPDMDVMQRFWQQCQHGTWYFLPWHRGYLLAFEANVRATIKALNGPDDWALPYWNYFGPNESSLPTAFSSNTWPGEGDNPLFVQQRYGPHGDGRVYIDLAYIDLKALGDTQFTGPASGVSPGFGGVDTGFQHGGRRFGGIENQPHNIVHDQVGGPQHGIMSDPDTAGLDPIFWLHHANIDRLWEVWRRTAVSNTDPTDPRWLSGPGSTGDREFAMPMPDGTAWVYTPGNMSDFANLPYTYDDLAPMVQIQPPSQRLLRLGASQNIAALAKDIRPMARQQVELVGTTEAPLHVSGDDIRTSVRLNQNTRRKVVMSLAKALEGSEPDHVFLNLENVRAAYDGTVFQVYVGLHADQTPKEHPENLAGSIALFGVRKASEPDSQHAGQGADFVLDITHIIDTLHLQNAFDVQHLDVRLLPLNPVPHDAHVSIGRISIYRQGPT